jgi:Cu-processing system ATP-binding protein
MNMAAQPAIELAGVAKHYRDAEAVRGVDLSAGQGEYLALVGHNGAGKTTLVKLMLGLTRPTAGSVRVLGVNPVSGNAVALRRAIGYLPETVAFQGAMSGREVLCFYARLKGETARACDMLLDRVGLAEAARRRVRTYSKGMRQRLGLAQALLGAPRLLFLDEPTTGLDPSLRRMFYDIVEELRHEGTTALISSHALSEIEARTDRVAIMKKGRLVACGTLDALRQAAGLPIRIRVLVTPGEASAVAERISDGLTLHKVNDRRVDLSCIPGDKMRVVRRLADLGEIVRDVDIAAPQLEEIYAHFTGEEMTP